MERLAGHVVAGLSVRTTRRSPRQGEGPTPPAGSVSVRWERCHVALSDAYDTRVTITEGRKGRIVIEFAGEAAHEKRQ